MEDVIAPKSDMERKDYVVNKGHGGEDQYNYDIRHRIGLYNFMCS